MKLRIFPLLALVLVLALLPVGTALADPYDPNAPFALMPEDLYAQAAVVMDADSGRILFDKNATERVYPASTTKIMTLLLACEYGHFDDMITIPEEASDISSDSSVVPVTPGETMRFIDLLYGLEMHSGNDAANAVAVIVSGSVANFVAMMNQRAQSLGMTGTHYANAHGLHDAMHYTTAQDLAILTAEALKNDTFRQIVSSLSYEMAPTEERGALWLSCSYDVMNPNSDLYYEGCIGVKSGFTSNAGQSFVGAAERDGLTLISVAMNCAPTNDDEAKRTKFVDTVRLLDFGFSQYDAYDFTTLFDLATQDTPLVTMVQEAHQDDPYGGQLTLSAAQVNGNWQNKMVYGDEAALNQAVQEFRQSLSVTIQQDVMAPVTSGQTLGSISYSDPEGNAMTGVLVASRSVEAMTFWYKLSHNTTFRVCVALLAAIIVIFIVLRIRVTVVRNRRRKQLMERKRRELERYQREQRMRGKW